MGKFTEYKLPLKSMPDGTHTFEYRLGKTFFTNMESADIHDADLTVTLTVSHKAGLYEMHFAIEGVVTLLCDRCLDDLEFPIDATYDINVKYGEDYNDDSDNLLVIPESDSYLNVAYMIYDTVALAIPIKHVHPMGKCNRQMSQILRKHRSQDPADSEEAELEDRLIDEMDSMPDTADDTTDTPADPRWSKLRDFNPDNDN